jgi:cytochrome c-type biogenesis protein CcmH
MTDRFRALRRFARAARLRVSMPPAWWLIAALMAPLLPALLAPGQATAQTARPMADDPVLEARVLEIAHELRCLVCQNETIAASHADLALDLRRQIREQLVAGRSEREILDYMVQRYGDFVLYNPPVKPVTWLLWGGPFVLLVSMAAWLAVSLRRRNAQAAVPPLSDDEQRRARDLLGPDRP